MKIRKQDITHLAADFANKLKEKDIWFSLDNSTLLGAIRHGGYIPWSEKFEVFLSLESYSKLKLQYPNNVVDSSEDKNYKSLTACWVKDKAKWNEEQPFIQIRVAVPTTIEKIKEFKSFKNRVLRNIKNKKEGMKLAISELYDRNNYQGFILMNSRKDYSWIQVISKKIEYINFLGHQMPVVKEYKKVLEEWFGENYMSEIVVPKAIYEYPGPLMKERVE